MKNLIYLLVSGLMLTACTSEDITPDPLADLQLAATLQNTAHKVALYTPQGRFETGYTPVTLNVTDLNGNAVEATALAWSPLMHMHSMSHGCPASALSLTTDGLYEGYLVFQMASNDSEYWELTVNYTVNGTEYTVKDRITVNVSEQRKTESFQGADGKRYIAALAEPAAPKVGVNDMKVLLYQMENMMTFTPVTGYLFKTDPRMPGMGNHSSPNNTDLTRGAEIWYEGKLNLTMTGYWKINLQLQGPTGEALKGEPVTEANEASSIFFEVEF